MGAIAVTDVNVSLLPTADPAGVQPNQVTIQGKQKVVRARFSISATKALTYPSSGGIPLPTWNLPSGNGDVSFGMVRNVSHVVFYDYPGKPSAGGGVMWRYDSSNHTIRGFGPNNVTTFPAAANVTGMSELPTTWSPSFGNPSGSSLDFYAMVYGW
jgi:hypothetical protein